MDWKWLFTSLDGRINRAKFWAGVGVMFVVMIVAIILDNLLGLTFTPEFPYGWLYALATIVLIWPAIVLYAKRWHDRDKSGWWSLIMLVPFIGGIWFLIECGILEGTRGPNRFGPDPLG